MLLSCSSNSVGAALRVVPPLDEVPPATTTNNTDLLVIHSRTFHIWLIKQFPQAVPGSIPLGHSVPHINIPNYQQITPVFFPFFLLLRQLFRLTRQPRLHSISFNPIRTSQFLLYDVLRVQWWKCKTRRQLITKKRTRQTRYRSLPQFTRAPNKINRRTVADAKSLWDNFPDGRKWRQWKTSKRQLRPGRASFTMWHTSASWLDGWMTGRKEEVSSKWGQWVLYAVQCTHSSISAKWTGYCKLISELPHPVSQGSNICSTSSGRSNSRLYSWPGSSLYKSWEMLSLYEQPNCAILGPFFPVLTSDKRFSLEWIITMIDV